LEEERQDGKMISTFRISGAQAMAVILSDHRASKSLMTRP
jgi:hypothetical protein